MKIVEKLIPILLFIALAASVGYIHPYTNGASFPQFALRSQTVSITANAGSAGDGLARYTIASPSKASYDISTADTDGARLFLGETGDLKNGQITGFTNTGTNAITIHEVANVVNMSGTTVVLGADDTIELKRANGIWIQKSLSNN